MPYKDPQKQKEAQARYFQENKSRLLQVQNKKRNKMRRKIQEAKESVPCKDCGASFPHYIMQFDHLPQYEKVFNISQVAMCNSMADLEAEIAKCDVVCANCHAHRTWMRLSKEDPIV